MTAQPPLFPSTLADDWQAAIGACNLKIARVKVLCEYGLIGAKEAVERIHALVVIREAAERVRDKAGEPCLAI